MDSPLAPKPVVPGLRPPPVDRGSRERKGKGQSFEHELAQEREDEKAAAQPQAPAPARPPSEGARKPRPRRPGHLLDVEA